MGGRPGQSGDIEEQLFEGFGEDRAIADGHRPKRVAVIGPFKGNQLAAFTALVAPPLPGHLQCHLDGAGAVVGEEEPLQTGVGTEAVGELFGGPVAEVGEDHLLERMGLAPNGGRDARFGVAMEGDPPTADGIDQRTAVFEFQQ